MRAVSNGLSSRLTNFKLNNDIAEILNLVITIKEGAITSLDWKNQCISKVCPLNNCATMSFKFKEKDYEDANCYIKTCKSSKETPTCDTKVYVSWVGNDNENRYCESDNFRITNLVQHSIRTYFDSAAGLAEITRPSVIQ